MRDNVYFGPDHGLRRQASSEDAQHQGCENHEAHNSQFAGQLQIVVMSKREITTHNCGLVFQERCLIIAQPATERRVSANQMQCVTPYGPAPLSICSTLEKSPPKA